MCGFCAWMRSRVFQMPPQTHSHLLDLLHTASALRQDALCAVAREDQDRGKLVAVNRDLIDERDRLRARIHTYELLMLRAGVPFPKEDEGA